MEPWWGFDKASAIQAWNNGTYQSIDEFAHSGSLGIASAILATFAIGTYVAYLDDDKADVEVEVIDRRLKELYKKYGMKAIEVTSDQYYSDFFNFDTLSQDPEEPGKPTSKRFQQPVQPVNRQTHHCVETAIQVLNAGIAYPFLNAIGAGLIERMVILHIISDFIIT